MYTYALNQSCVFCNSTVEDCNHLFLTYSVSSSIWLGLNFTLPQHIIQLYLLLGECIIKGNKGTVIKHIFWLATCWCIWNLRNSIIFREAKFDFMGIIANIKATSWQWLLYRRGVKGGIFFHFLAQQPIGVLVSLVANIYPYSFYLVLVRWTFFCDRKSFGQGLGISGLLFRSFCSLCTACTGAFVIPLKNLINIYIQKKKHLSYLVSTR